MSDELNDLANVVSDQHGGRRIHAKQTRLPRRKMGCIARAFWVVFGAALVLVTAFYVVAYLASKNQSKLSDFVGRSKELPHPITPDHASYDKFKDRSQLLVGPSDDRSDWTFLELSPDGQYALPKELEDGVYFQISYSFSGRTITSVQGINFAFYGNDDMFRTKIFLVDGRRFTVDSVWISPDDLLAIGKAKSAEVQVHDKNYKFSPSQQEKILIFLDQLGID